MESQHPALYELLGHSMQGDLGGFTCYTARRNKVVWFVKSPPLEPPSPTQTAVRNLFRLNAAVWRSMPLASRATWNDAAGRAGLRIHGYDLFQWWMRSRDNAALATIERHAGLAIDKPQT